MAKKTPVKPSCPVALRRDLLTRLESEIIQGDTARIHAVLDEWESYRQPAWRSGSRFPSKNSVTGTLTQYVLDPSVRARISQGATMIHSWYWDSLAGSGVPDPAVWDWLSDQCVPGPLEVFRWAAPGSTTTANHIDRRDIFLIRYPSIDGKSHTLIPPQSLKSPPSHTVPVLPRAARPMNSILLTSLPSTYSLFQRTHTATLPKDHPLHVLADTFAHGTFSSSLLESLRSVPQGGFQSLDVASIHRRSRLRSLVAASWANAARSPAHAQSVLRALKPEGAADPVLVRRLSTAIAESYVASALWGEKQWSSSYSDPLFPPSSAPSPSNRPTRFASTFWNPLTRLNKYLHASDTLIPSEEDDAAVADPAISEAQGPEGDTVPGSERKKSSVSAWLVRLLDDVLRGAAPRNDPATYLDKVQEMMLDRALLLGPNKEATAVLLGQVVRDALSFPPLEVDSRKHTLRCSREDVAAWKRLTALRPELQEGWEYLEEMRQDAVTKAKNNTAQRRALYPDLLFSQPFGFEGSRSPSPVSSIPAQVKYQDILREQMGTKMGVPVEVLLSSRSLDIRLNSGAPRPSDVPYMPLGSLFFQPIWGGSAFTITSPTTQVGDKLSVLGMVLVDDPAADDHAVRPVLTEFSDPTFNHLLVRHGHPAVIDLVATTGGAATFQNILDSDPSLERAFWVRATPEVLRAVFRADPTLAERRDAFGNTPVHWALLGDILQSAPDRWSPQLRRCTKELAQVLVTHARTACLEANQAGIVPADAPNLAPAIQAAFHKSLLKGVVRSGPEGRARTAQKAKDTRAAHAVGLSSVARRKM